MKKFLANHHDRKISHDGVDDFFWPITHKPMTEFGERFFYDCADLLREYPDQKSALIYKFSVKYLVAIAGGIFQADLLYDKLADKNMQLIVPDNWLVWPHIMKGMAPPRTPFLETLRRRKKEKSFLHKISDFKRYKRLLGSSSFKFNGMQLDGLSIRSMNSNIAKSNIVATQRTPLISRMAASLKEDIVLARSDFWFSFVSDQEVEVAAKYRNEDIESKLLAIIFSLYREKAIELSPYVRTYLADLLSEMASLLAVHYNRLLDRDDIPKRLWTGTGGQIWDLMLRSAVLEKGGYVTAFDHGGGTAHVSLPLVGFIELWACHEFITYNETQANDIRSSADDWPKLDGMNPKIGFVPKILGEPAFFMRPDFQNGRAKIKKIYVLSTLYDQDRGRSFAFYPDLTYVDWQARLMAKLKEWNYDVYFKPHPESKSPPPAAFENDLGAAIVKEKFEDILQDADLFLIDYTFTSIMIPAFLSNIPIVLVDFDDLPWREKALGLISGRANIVEGKFNSENRIDVDWDRLKRAIETATEKCNNHDYARTYYI